MERTIAIHRIFRERDPDLERGIASPDQGIEKGPRERSIRRFYRPCEPPILDEGPNIWLASLTRTEFID